MPERPFWWDWELEYTAHVLKRMLERDFTDIDLRIMLDTAESLGPAAEPGRLAATTRHNGQLWRVIVEPIQLRHVILVVTAYPVGAE